LGITLNPLAIKCSVHIHIIPYYLLVVYRRFIRPFSVEPNRSKVTTTSNVIPATLAKFFMGKNFFLYMYIITKNPYAWQGRVDGLITVYAFLLQNVMPAVSDVSFFPF